MFSSDVFFLALKVLLVLNFNFASVNVCLDGISVHNAQRLYCHQITFECHKIVFQSDANSSFGNEGLKLVKPSNRPRSSL